MNDKLKTNLPATHFKLEARRLIDSLPDDADWNDLLQ
ncbi:MAG: hypothetical protein JWN70_1182, partial [Planctomycetaceae bacterium]|nr:hypothetical protein [Planctomycetaceae bacterium]